MILRALAAWGVMMVLAIGNGAFREGVLTPRMGGAWSHVASTLLLCGLIAGVVWGLWRWVGVSSCGEAWAVGGMWLALTLGFEFLAGHYLFGVPWSKIMHDYNVAEGRIWPLVPATTLLAPVMAWWRMR